MKKVLFVLILFILASCTNNNETDLIRDSNVNDESPRVIEQMDFVEFIDSHEEAETLQEEHFIDPDNLEYNLIVQNDPVENGMYGNQLVLRIEVETDEELVIGSTHFRMEHYNGEEWEQIDNVPYGVEDAQVIITSEEPYEYIFYDINEFETEFDTGVYRVVNSGYAFPFSIYVLE